MIRSFFLTSFAQSAVVTSAGAVVIPVTNPSFEQPALNLCAFGPPITGWTVSNGGVWRTGGAGQCFNSYPDGLPDGLQVAFTNGGDLEQVLTTNLAANTRYVLRVRSGRRFDTCCQAGTYAAQLRAGASVLFQTTGANTAPGTFTEVTVQFATGATHPQLGQPLRIRLVDTGTGQENYDHVRLESFPADCNSNGIFDAIDIANGTPDTNGNGVPDSCETLACIGDIAPPGGNNTVNVSDLLAVIGAWGACANPNNCPADIAPAGGNDVVNVSDLLAVIGNWGACP